ncbi:protein kinase [Methanoregula sp.]|uniref:protein kinase domain-containing protein n=1 Tax=Methanoregula sp. TaxID=2052170 RepID=UPI002604F8DD|nr:protein kinase [Methanoregula sp.]MDD5141860.1 protein kinase [Methanoregula sp.]
MPLAIGQRVKAELSGTELHVLRKLGEGTQGEVYLVEGPQGYQAVKWYKPEQATAEQRSAILYLVRTGPPFGAAGRRFIWPLDLVTREGSGQFGYLMARIDTQKFAELGEVWAHLKPVPNFSSLSEISYQLANSYRALHLSGHCYRDISAGNLMFEPVSGDILICDNDNVGVNRQSRCQVWGTMEYMAPEIIRGEADPSTQTDLHSLAILLFYLWVWHHPFHGEMEYRFHCWDIPAKKKVYGETPIFVFDPENPDNRLPTDPDYGIARERWSLCPTDLQDMFIRAFTDGLKDPSRRVTEGEWQNLFSRIKDRIISCPRCRAENFLDLSGNPGTCWNCSTSLPHPPFLVVRRHSAETFIALSNGTTLRRRHVTLSPANDDGSAIIGIVVPHPAIPGASGIRNATRAPWNAEFPDGSKSVVPPGRAIPLNPGAAIMIDGVTITITAPDSMVTP